MAGDNTRGFLDNVRHEIEVHNLAAVRHYFYPCKHVPKRSPFAYQLCEIALSYAVFHESLDIVRYLILEHKVDVNSLVRIDKRKRIGNFAEIAIAVKKGNEDIVELLLYAGVRIDKASTHGENLLCFAVENSKREIIELLLNYGADVKSKDNLSRRPMDIALKRGDAEIVQLLLDHGAQVDLETALKKTIAKKNEELATVLLTKQLDPEFLNTPAVEDLMRRITRKLVIKDKADFDLDKSLREAILHKDKKLISTLLTKKADDEYKNSCAAGNLLKFVIEKGQIDIVKLLLDNGININVRNDSKRSTALHAAVKMNNIKILNLLLSRGANISKTDERRRSALHYAVTFLHVKEAIIETLVNYGIDINQVDKNGLTPLLTACEKNNERGLVCLIDLGADVTILDKSGRCLIDVAFVQRHFELVAVTVNRIMLMYSMNQQNRSKIFGLTLGESGFECLRKNCKTDICLLKSAKIGGSSNLSSFDVFISSDIDQLAELSKNKDIQQFYENTNFIKDYRVYGSDICKKYLTACVQAECRSKLNSLFMYLANREDNELPQLPSAAIDRVLSCLCFDEKILFNMRLELLRKKS